MINYKQQCRRFLNTQHDVLLIMGDVNAKTGSDNTDRERAIGREGCGIINGNGEKFVNFCLNNNCVIGGTIS